MAKRRGRLLVAGATAVGLALLAAASPAAARVYVDVGGIFVGPPPPWAYYPGPYYYPYPVQPYPYVAYPAYPAPSAWAPGHWEWRQDRAGTWIRVWIPAHLR